MNNTETINEQPIESLTEGLMDIGANADGDPRIDNSRDVRDEETGEMPVEALAQALTFQGMQFAAANQHEKQAENPDDFVFDGPFDAQKAIDEMFRLNRSVGESERVWKKAKEYAAARKAEYDEAVSAFTTRVRELEDWKSGIEQQPRLKTLTDVERAKETVDERRHRLSEQLPRKNFYITEDELSGMERGDLDTLDAWLTMADGVVPPELLTRAHVAGPTGAEHGAHCTKCGAALGMRTEGETAADYPEQAFVGFECDGVMREEARPIKPRGSKKGRKKVDHDAERHAQQDAQSRSIQKASARCECGATKTITATDDPRQFATACPTCGDGSISWAATDDAPEFVAE
jgi:hypothetical protein